MGISKRRSISSLIAVFVISTLLSGCTGKQAQCDDLLNALSYGPWSQSDSDWFDKNCRG
jgi:hypothetical protein